MSADVKMIDAFVSKKDKNKAWGAKDPLCHCSCIFDNKSFPESWMGFALVVGGPAVGACGAAGHTGVFSTDAQWSKKAIFLEK